jgi:predicted HTH transcriptional regulator
MLFYQFGAITAILSLLQIPMELKNWNIAVLDSLLKYREIERDSFDFKGRELNKLETHLCAMANTVIGILALEVDNPSSDNPNAVFTKKGFRKGTEEQILNSISNSVVKVDPLPRVTHEVLPDPQSDRFYVILKVEGLESQRPYTIKDSAQIFVRIGGSTRPAVVTR